MLKLIDTLNNKLLNNIYHILDSHFLVNCSQNKLKLETMSIHHLIHSHFIFLLIIPVVSLIYIIVKKVRNQEAPKKITKEKYESTMINKMIDVTDSEKPMFNIWPYINDLKKVRIIPKKIDESNIVHKVYRNTDEHFEHILLNTDKRNKYVVIVANLNKHKVKGYYIVDLPNQEYSL